MSRAAPGMTVDYKVSLISASPPIYHVIAIENDGTERVVARYLSYHRAELRARRLRAMMAAGAEGDFDPAQR